MRNELKYLLILLIVFLVLLIVIWNGKYSDLEKFEPDKGPFNSEELIELQLELRDKMCIEDKYPDYYAGCYTEKGNLIILLTTRANKIKREIKELLGQEEGIFSGMLNIH